MVNGLPIFFLNARKKRSGIVISHVDLTSVDDSAVIGGNYLRLCEQSNNS